MSSNTRLKRASLSDTNLHSEMKTWRKNKMEDRKLALQNEVVDKHMVNRRKSYQYEKHSLNKEFDDKFSKKTPTADEYLEKSQAKYATWKEREKERLDRKYRSLHKSYLQAYKKLGIKNYSLQKERKKSESEIEDENPNEDVDNEKETESVVDESMTEEDAMTALGKLNLEISKRRFSEFHVGNKNPSSRRRGSTGSIDLAEFAKLRSLHLALTSVAEDTQDNEESEEESETCDKLEDLNDITTKRKVVTIREEPVEDITVEDLIVKPKRRASIATITKLPVKENPIPLGKRFDRRPTLPNVAIPFNYGN